MLPMAYRPLDVSCWKVISSFLRGIGVGRCVGRSIGGDGGPKVEVLGDLAIVDSNGLEDLSPC